MNAAEIIKKDLEFKVTNIVHDPVGLSAYMDRTALNELLEYDNADDFAEEFGDGDYDEGYDDAYDYWEERD